MSISVGSVSVDVVPSTKGFAEDLKAKLKGITATIAVDADTARLRAQLDEATRARTATINVNADTAFAEAQIAAVAQDRTANVRVSSSGLSEVVSGVSGLAATVALLGPALIPVVAVIAGLGAALIAPLALAGGGLTIGAILGGFAIKGTETQNKQIGELAKKVDAARLAVARASTPAGRKSAQAILAQDTKAYQSALAALTPAQKQFLAAQDKLKSSFKGLVSSAGGALFGPFIKGMDLLAKIMPALKPLLVGVSNAIGTLLGDLSKAASGPGFKNFLKSFGREAGGAIVAFGHMFGDFAKGLFRLFKAFSPASKGFVTGLAGTAKAFAKWSQSLGSSKSFQAFLAYIKDVGPKVASALGHIIGAVGKIVVALAPLGALSLGALDALAKFIVKAKPSQIVAIAGAIGGLAVAVALLGGPVVAIPAAILAIAGALAYAYAKSGPFHKAVDAIGHVFTDRLLPALEKAWHTILPGLVKGFDNVKQSIHNNQGLFRVLGDVFKILGKVLVGVVIPLFAKLVSLYLPALGKAIGIAITGLRLFVDANLVMVKLILQGFKLLVLAASSTFGAIIDAAAAGLGWIPGIGDKIKGAQKAFHEFRDNTVAALDKAITKVQDLRTELDTIKPKTIHINFAIGKTPVQTVGGFPIFKQPKVAGASGGIVSRPTVALIGEAGPEAVVPLNQTPGNSPLPNGRSAPQFNVEKVVAQDVNDFLDQMQVRARHSSLDGIRR